MRGIGSLESDLLNGDIVPQLYEVFLEPDLASGKSQFGAQGIVGDRKQTDPDV